MAEEATAGADQSAAIDALFSGEPAPQPGEGAPPDPGAAGAPDPNAEDAWTDGYVPKAFRGEDGSFNGDQNAVFKSWYDGRQRVSQLEAQIAQAAKEAKALVPETADEYISGMDWENLKAKAPNSYAGGEAENPVVVNLLREAHAAGVPPAKAQHMVTEYLASLNEHVPEAKDEATQRSEAVAHLGPNGAAIAEQVKTRLKTLSQRQAIPEPQMAVLGQMMLNGPALALLDRLTAYGGSKPPPGASTITVLDQDKARADARKKLGTLDGEDWAKNKDRYLAEWRAAHPEWDDVGNAATGA